MDAVFTFSSQHPVIAIAIAATFLVVTLYFIKKHIWRIILILILTFVGYYLYTNGYLTKDNIKKVTSVDLNDVEKGAEKALDKGVEGVKSFTAQKAEEKADQTKAEVKQEMMNELKAAPGKAQESARAAAAQAAHKKKPPAAGGKDAGEK
jgi:hypothetical protein